MCYPESTPIAAPRTWRQTVVLFLGVMALLLGWLSPQYVAKLWGPELNEFLSKQPVAAAVISQVFWSVLLLAPSVGAEHRSDALLGRDDGSPKLCGQRTCNHAWIAVPLGVLVAIVHAAWYKSFSGTNVATNTLLWNTDTVTTPLVATLVAHQLPTRATLLGGLCGLVGAGLAVGASDMGDTLLGCGLCFGASVGFAFNAVLVEHTRDPVKMSIFRLLGLEGFTAAIVLAGAIVVSSVWRPGSITEWMLLLPSCEWIAFLGFNSLLLNIGWLSCAEIAGSFWTAMVACLSIPLTMGLDFLLIGTMPTMLAVIGGLSVIVGFLLASKLSLEPQNVHDRRRASELTPNVCQRWVGWMRARSYPLLADPQRATVSDIASMPTEHQHQSTSQVSASRTECSTDGKRSTPNPELLA